MGRGDASGARRGPDPASASFDGVDVSKPMLVFVHGTASNTRGSFGQFLTKEAEAEWRILKDFFGNRIYAFEHRTLSRSPIENAIVLAEQLPDGANLHIVSHSRGGIVGDLLCIPPLAPGRRGGALARNADCAAAMCLRVGDRRVQGGAVAAERAPAKITKAARAAAEALTAAETLASAEALAIAERKPEVTGGTAERLRRAVAEQARDAARDPAATLKIARVPKRAAAWEAAAARGRRRRRPGSPREPPGKPPR